MAIFVDFAYPFFCFKVSSWLTGYSFQRWKELVTYTTDRHLNIDNKPVKLHYTSSPWKKKSIYGKTQSHQTHCNNLFANGHLQNARYQIINYLRDVLHLIGSHPNNQIEMLLLQNWKADGWVNVIGRGIYWDV